MAARSKEPSWTTKALIRKSQPLADDPQFQKALKSIENTQEAAGMKHLLANWAAEERLAGPKLPEKLLSRKKSSAFKEAVRRQMMEDRGTFRLSGITTAFAMVLVCSFFRNAMYGTYLINFSVDAIVGALGAGLAILNLKTQFQVARLYGKTTDMLVTDLLALLLWFLLVQVFRAFDPSILVFLVTYFFSLWRFKKMQKTFIEENHLDISLSSK